VRNDALMTRWLRPLILAIVLIPVQGHAATFGVVDGIIADDVGGPLPSARVSIERVHGALSRYTESGGMGFYLFADLPAGTYTITASHPNFESASVRVSVTSGQKTEVSLQLRLRRSGGINAFQAPASDSHRAR
jgi:Carboxypeptidase regulatory-like domain